MSRGRVRSGLVAVLTSALLAMSPGVAAADDSDWTINGRGWGHGVGMSQYGAMEMAKDGKSAAEILQHYYTGTTYDTVPDTAVLAVNIGESVTTSTLRSSALSTGGGTVKVEAGGVTMTVAAGVALTARQQGSGVAVSCSGCTPVTTVSGDVVKVTWDDDRTLLTVGSRRYKDGHITIRRAGNTDKHHVIAHLRIHDEYLDYIAEVPWSWPVEALKAQAAAARGYALTAHASGIQNACACHVRDSVADQVFAGYPAADRLGSWSRWTQAVRAANSPDRGYVVRHKGAIARTFYYASSGGRTQNNEDVWAGSALPYLRSVSDPWSQRSSNPKAEWSSRHTPAAMAAAWGLDDVARLDLSNRHSSGYVATAVATSSSGRRATLTGPQVRSALSLNSSHLERSSIRHGGADRYSTAARVAEAVSSRARAVVIASGEENSLIDATVGGPLAGAVAGPILLTRVGSLPPATVAELDRRRTRLTTAYVLGGQGAVSATVVRALEARGLEVVRLGGSDRFETARRVAAEIARHRSVAGVILTEADAIADVVSASGPSAALGQPILLTAATTLSPATRAALTELSPKAAFLAGGLIKDGVESDIRSLVPSVTRLSGRDRYATAAAVARHFAPSLDYSSVVISSGLEANLIDAISAGALRQPMLFVRPGALPAATQEAIQRLPGAGQVRAVGGTTAVSPAVLTAAARS
ncbi:MAG TPA: SpoIID/LytB domain-containing protein [Intrasporangiaceae bacterium]|nr:SpoIID/LytB domain-containing protein [Intrasporangiaceae bacterium]